MQYLYWYNGAKVRTFSVTTKKLDGYLAPGAKKTQKLYAYPAAFCVSNIA